MSIAEYHKESFYLFIIIIFISDMFSFALGPWAIQYLVPGYPKQCREWVPLYGMGLNLDKTLVGHSLKF